MQDRIIKKDLSANQLERINALPEELKERCMDKLSKSTNGTSTFTFRLNSNATIDLFELTGQLGQRDFSKILVGALRKYYEMLNQDK